MKFIVETKGDRQVYGSGADNHARHNRPSVVKSSNFMQGHIASGNVTVLHQIDDAATDDLLAAHLDASRADAERTKKDFDQGAALAAFAEKHKVGKDRQQPAKGAA